MRWNINAARYLGLLLLASWGMLTACEKVSKPEIRGSGPLQIVVPAGKQVPEYHIPAERWLVQHNRAISLQDFSVRECILCHNPQTSCHRCHAYVAVRKINLPEAAILWSSKEKKGNKQDNHGNN